MVRRADVATGRRADVAIYIDPPTWPGPRPDVVASGQRPSPSTNCTPSRRGIGAPRRAFERDHYDLPAERYGDAVRAGAVEVGSKELVRRLTAAGLRRPKNRPAPRV